MPEYHHPWKLLGIAMSVCSTGLWCSLRQHVFRPRLTDPYLTLRGVLTIILGRLGYSFIATNKVAGGVAPTHVTHTWRIAAEFGAGAYVGIAVLTVTDLERTVVTVCSTCY